MGTLSVATGLENLAREAVARARLVGRPILVSVVEEIDAAGALALFHAAEGIASGTRLYWERPDVGEALVGVGEAWTVESAGSARFDDTARAWGDLLRTSLVWGDAPVPAAGPVLIGGFAFDDQRPSTAIWRGYPSGRMILPRVTIARAGSGAALTRNAIVAPDADPETTAVDLARSAAFVRDAAPGTAAFDPLKVELTRPGARRRDAPSVAADPERYPAGVVGAGAAGPDGAHGAPGAPDTWPGALTFEDVLDPAIWTDLVARATTTIRAGALEKVVLARARRVRHRAGFDLAAVLAALGASYPSCAIFAIERDGAAFVGATPERLARVRAGRVEVSCLAGTAPRGATDQDDRQLGADLLASPKNRHEHAVVARMLSDRLASVCRAVDVPSAPVLLKVRNVQHLFSPVVGELAPGRTLLDIAARLHPTPAVGGFPDDLAVRFIREHEQLDRGWYAGPVGWLSARGEGELAVALRSGLLRASRPDHGPLDEAVLLAGCGIVADSDPAAELAESVLKFRPMADALQAAAR